MTKEARLAEDLRERLASAFDDAVAMRDQFRNRVAGVDEEMDAISRMLLDARDRAGRVRDLMTINDD